ncbi:MAG: ABC transporter ATP-binding protein [Acidobacteriota bacterium]|nr:ABC transporter ATP-binding protein [Acidobacteriota bacterium]
MADTRPAVRISDLVFRYGEGDFELSIADLTIERGRTAAFVGPSGSGKTTLLNLVAGIAAPASGVVETHGVEISSLPDAGRRDFRIRHIGLVFQEFELLEYLSVLDNILLPYRINPSLRLDAAVRERAVDLAGQVGIADKVGRYPHRLSQGERQRVAVCRAVLPQPAVLLADEPTGNLDPVNADRVLDILLGFAAESGATLLAVTHDHDLLPRFEHVIDFKAFQRAEARS